MPADNISVTYGYTKGEAFWQGRALMGKEVCHAGWLHYWSRDAYKLLAGNEKISCIFYVEDDVRFCAPFQEVVATVASASKPVVWVGYESKPKFAFLQGRQRRGCGYGSATSSPWSLL